MVFEQRLPAQRREEVYRLIAGRRFASVKELSEALGVSEMTIRRDLRFLERKGLVRRIFGGAQLAEPQIALEESYERRMAQNKEAKEAIARLAKKLIAPGDTVALDGSTTALYLARELRNLRITVITNSLLVAGALLGSEAQVLVVGGELRAVSQTLVGPLAEEALGRFHPDKAFFSAKGLTTQGLMDSHLGEVAVKQQMLRMASQRIALLDGSKFGVRGLCTLIPLDQVHVLITDALPPGELQDAIRDASVALRVAGGENARAAAPAGY